MRSVVLLWGMLSLIFGQAPSLAWVELADTVYGIDGSTQDTFTMVIQSRSGNVRRFDRYDTTGGRLFLASYDSVYLDGSSGRVQRTRSYERRDPNATFSFAGEWRFSYPGSPALKAEFFPATSPNNPDLDLLCYGLTIFEGSVAFVYVSGDATLPVEAYPVLHHIGQLGDSVLGRDIADNSAFATVRRTRPSACDTLIEYDGPVNGPFTPSAGGKICHTNGRIDSIISANEE
jgi:hypothetical protein